MRKVWFIIWSSIVEWVLYAILFIVIINLFELLSLKVSGVASMMFGISLYGSALFFPIAIGLVVLVPSLLLRGGMILFSIFIWLIFWTKGFQHFEPRFQATVLAYTFSILVVWGVFEWKQRRILRT